MKTILIGVLIEKGRDITQCPSYYAADYETLRLKPGRYNLYVTVEGGFTCPMPSMVVASIPADRIAGETFSGFGGVNYSSRSLPLEETTYHFNSYAHSLKELIAQGRVEILPEFSLLVEDRIAFAKSLKWGEGLLAPEATPAPPAPEPEPMPEPEVEAVPNIRTDPISFLGYEIGQSGNDGILLRKGSRAVMSYESHLGYYDSVDSAKRAAVLYFMLARPNTFAGELVSIISDRARAADLPVDYYRFLNAVKEAGLTMPEELTDGGGKPAPCKRENVALETLGYSSVSTYGGVHLYYKGEVFVGCF